VLAVTAHNLNIHNRANEAFLARNIRRVHTEARVVFVHSGIARQRLIEALELSPEKVQVIPHGDLSVALGIPHRASEARCQLGLDSGKLALVFGTVEPYKGLEEIIDWWRHAQPDFKLAIVGRPTTPDYGSQVLRRIGGAKNIMHRLDWLPDELLRLWLSAADVTIFNYRKIFTSGAANLARCYGVPIMLPKHLDTVVLDEPTPYVRRFTSFVTDFGEQLAEALAVRPDFAAAASWREACNWDKVACLTAAGYRDALG
jgi:glycosyltransferase involved in cell wall biosynthesis